MNCCECEAIDQHFGEAKVKEELNRYHSKGPHKTTRILLKGIGSQNLRSATLLDIGSGIGVILHELPADSITDATLVESSSSYLSAAEAEALRGGQRRRVTFVHGDVVQLSEQLPKADLVTLDRVVCCYPYFEKLLAASADRSLKWFALSYPRNRWYVRLGNAFENWQRSRRANPFRTYIHPEHRIHEIILVAGFDRCFYQRTLGWHVAVYGRPDADLSD